MTTNPAGASAEPLDVDTSCEFLRRYAPFNRMPEPALRALSGRLALVHYPKDATILTTQHGPVAHLYIVLRGLVGSRPNNVQADPDRTLGEGDLFPIGALSAGGPTTRVFHAMQDTDCYMLGRDDFLALRRDSPEFERYCTQAITEKLKQSLESLYSQYSQRAAEQQTLTRTLGELGRSRPSRALSTCRWPTRCSKWPTPRCARSWHWMPQVRRSACSHWSICCGAWCCPADRSRQGSRR